MRRVSAMTKAERSALCTLIRRRYTALAGLLDSGDKAMGWFHHRVLPTLPGLDDPRKSA
jgi:hypothetical protein